jgi:hypothetical protein
MQQFVKLRSPSSTDFELILLQRKQRRRRKAWVLNRSTCWVKGVLSGSYLPDPEFQRTFRMNRNSFEQLHALLGKATLDIWLI